MKLLILGSTGYHPNEHRHTACMMLPEIGVVLDAGTGMFRVGRHLQTATLDIFLTHVHLDHVVGITYLFDVLNEKPLDAVRVYVEADKLRVIEQHLLARPLFPVHPPCELLPLEEQHRLAGGGRLTHFPLKHPSGCVGFRLDWPDRSMAYVTDTTAVDGADYIERIRGVDLLVHECYFPDGHEQMAEKTGHSCATPVAQVAHQAGVGRLLLMHVNPALETDDPIGIESVRAIFPRAEVAWDNQQVDF